MKKFFLMALLIATPAMAQAPAANLHYGWAPKPAAAPFIAPNRPHWKLADLLKSHAGRRSWSQVVVRDATGLTGAYIQMAIAGACVWVTSKRSDGSSPIVSA